MDDIFDRVYLTSPNYPGRYSASTKCTWLFSSQQGSTYVIQYNDLNMEDSDNLYIGKTHRISDDTMVSKMSWWFSPKTVRVSNQKMWIQFVSNNDTWLDTGFFLQVTRAGADQGI